MKLAIEMRDGPGYGKVHREGCRDLRDPEPIGEATSRDHISALAEDATGWEDGHTGISACVKL